MFRIWVCDARTGFCVSLLRQTPTRIPYVVPLPFFLWSLTVELCLTIPGLLLSTSDISHAIMFDIFSWKCTFWDCKECWSFTMESIALGNERWKIDLK